MFLRREPASVRPHPNSQFFGIQNTAMTKRARVPAVAYLRTSSAANVGGTRAATAASVKL